jgi:NAD-dependent dihydropyrimidine dehydrogenase PreA subunit
MATVLSLTNLSRNSHRDSHYRHSTGARLDTYNSCPETLLEWPRNGYVYVAAKDCVQCADCEASVSNWREINASEEIRKFHKSECHFLNPEECRTSSSQEDEIEFDGPGYYQSEAIDLLSPRSADRHHVNVPRIMEKSSSRNGEKAQV